MRTYEAYGFLAPSVHQLLVRNWRAFHAAQLVRTELRSKHCFPAISWHHCFTTCLYEIGLHSLLPSRRDQSCAASAVFQQSLGTIASRAACTKSASILSSSWCTRTCAAKSWRATAHLLSTLLAFCCNRRQTA